jgi:outer membrane protein
MAEASYSYISKIGLFRAKVGQDVLDHSRGQLANLSWHVPWMTECFVVMPGVGVEYASPKHNEYYYGISSEESARSGLQSYNPGGSFSPYATLEAKFSLRDKWEVVAKGQVQYLSRRVYDSPMIGKSYAASLMAGVQYTF